MSTEQNKTLIRRGFEEGINGRNLDYFTQAIAPTYVNHNMPVSDPGPEGFKQVIAMFVNAFPDMQITVEDVIGEGDKVATRGTWRGTHQGDFMGIPATGKSVTVTYSDIWRLENDKAVENWVQMDILGLMQQLGVAPAPGQG
jgi:steroid delta-isomerase-like uncharacterized protein